MMDLRRMASRIELICAVLLLIAAAVSAVKFPGIMLIPNMASARETVNEAGYRACVVVDAGHGGKDRGTSGYKTGIGEAELNLKVAKLVQAGLAEANVKVIMTREDENALGSSKKADMAKRRELMRGDGVDLVVSIHMNSFTDHSIYGPMAFYMKGSEEGEKLATCVIREVCLAIDHPIRFANPGDYFVIRECTAPAVLIECGFLSNASDEAKLTQPEHQQKLAQGIVSGVLSYLDQANLNH